MKLQSSRELHEEHEAIKRALALLQRVARALQAERSGAGHDARRLLDFFSSFGDGCHHSKEERFFFPAVEKSKLPFDQESIDRLVGEHQQGREYLEVMHSRLEDYEQGEVSAAADFRHKADGYAAMLYGHIEREEEELLNHAEAAFSGPEDRRIAVEFERLEEQEIGAGVHEEFHALLEELEGTYPPSEREKE
jgi:hemerythrin-like domain-containing protein